MAATAPLVFIAAGWRSRQVAARLNGERDHMAALSTLYRTPTTTLDPSLCDVAEATHIALKRLSPMLSEHAIHLDIAIRPGLIARMRGPLLADMLEELLTLGIYGSPNGMLLLTASVRGDRIYISLSDDRPNQDLAAHEATARGLAERVALRGGALDVTVRPDEGATMTLRLAAAVAVSADMPDVTDDSDFALGSRLTASSETIVPGRYR